jgi:hypothetical protein
MARIAASDVGRAELVLVEVIAVRMVQVAVVHVIDMILVPHGEMPARLAVHVLVPIVNVFFHDDSFHRLTKRFGSASCAQGGFGSMLQTAADEFRDVRVGKRIINVLTLPAPRDQAVVMQQAQALRNGRHLLADFRGDLRNAPFAATQQLQNPQPRRIAERKKQLCRPRVKRCIRCRTRL